MMIYKQKEVIKTHKWTGLVAQFAIPGTGTYVLRLSEGFVCPRVYTLTDKLFAEMGIPIVLDLVIRPADVQRSKTTCKTIIFYKRLQIHLIRLYLISSEGIS
jgi:hypothetical protein